MLTALPTTYRGTRFRSTLEADWAATFDHLGWYWEYEPVALDLGAGMLYLPDFRLPGQRAWVEVKGPHDEGLDKTRQVLRTITAGHRGDLVLVARPAGPGNVASWHSADGDHSVGITRCGTCNQWCFNQPRADQWRCRHCNCRSLLPEATYIAHAHATAVQEQFTEHDSTIDWVDFWYQGHGRLQMCHAPRQRRP